MNDKLKLTDEQKKLAEENHNLIYYYCKKHNVDIDEWYGAIAIGFCKGIMTFDCEKGKLSTYLMRCMDNEYKHELRKLNRKSTCPMSSTSIDDCFWIADELGKNYDVELINFKNVISKLTKREKKIFQLYIGGMKMHEIAEELGLSQSYISRILGKIKNQIRGE